MADNVLIFVRIEFSSAALPLSRHDAVYFTPAFTRVAEEKCTALLLPTF
jgi:hypothetical protein